MATAAAATRPIHASSHTRDIRENGTPANNSSRAGADTDPGDPMELSPGSRSVRPSPSDRDTPGKPDAAAEGPHSRSNGPAIGAAAAGQQPKVVQTAFIHKLYNMLEDQKIQHLISWSSSNESFVINPSSEFSKVLATYFKHTNISSFVRQLNMYGFHKVSDVFSTGTPETPLWEFKHGEGNFKRGDLNGLREIKRRASKHALIHRDTVSAVSKATTAQQPPHVMNHEAHPPESTETRINMLEQTLFDVHTRLAKSEESSAIMAAKYHELSDKLAVSYQHNHDLSGMLAKICEDPENPVRRECLLCPVKYSISLANRADLAQSLQRDIGAQLASMRATDGMYSSDRSPRSVRGLFDHSMPASPGRSYYDDRRRASIQSVASRQSLYRPLAPSPHRHGSLGGATSPSSRALAPPPPPPLFGGHTPPPSHAQPPSINVQSAPIFPRRHTSADIHSHWPGATGQPGGGYGGHGHEYVLPNPASPQPFGADQQIRDKLASYSFGGNRGSISHQSSRGPSPPPREQAGDNSWALPPAVRMPFRDVFKPSGISSQNSSAAPTRRSSMANIQAMLNPADTAETEEEHGMDDGEDMRNKRKRVG